MTGAQRGDLRRPSSALSLAEAARLAAMDAAPDAPESYAATVERMARAMHEAVCDCGQGATSIDEAMASAALRAEHEGGAAS